jgi:fatty-acyl-CoA synthase
MEFHFADAWEAIAEAIPESPALICGGVTRDWRAFEARAASLATALARAGLGAGARAGVYLQDSNECLEAQFALFKLGGCAVNIDTRHKADELVRLLDLVGAEAVVYPSCFAARIWEIQKRLPKVKCFVEVADGTENIPVRGRVDYETALREHAAQPRARVHPADAACAFLASGTTRRPRLLTYRQGELCAALVREAFAAHGIDAPGSLAALADGVRGLQASGSQPVSLLACPLAHLGSMWLGALPVLLVGGTVVTMRRSGFDADLTWEEVGERRASELVIGGDAFARPLLAALDVAAAEGRPYALASLRRIVSSGAMWRRATKQGLLGHHDLCLHDVLLAVEGRMGMSVMTRDHAVATAAFARAPGVRVLAEDGRDVQPGGGEVGGGEVGEVAVRGVLPIDACEDAAHCTDPCRLLDGERHGMPGDHARLAADGSLLLLGRGSQCIETARGTVYAEVVEEVLKDHPAVLDCLVVGQPAADGEVQVIALAAVDEALADAAVETERTLLAFAHAHLPEQQQPARVLPVTQVRRSANGKPDYRWAIAAWAEHDAASRLQ